jgi:predicted outer membrane repeat protein
MSGPNSSASVVTTELKHNSAGSTGLGGAIFAGPESALKCLDVVVAFNSASKGGGLLFDLASVSLSMSTVRNNSATDKGGGIFCVSSLSQKGLSVLILNDVTVAGNFLQNSGTSAVGAAVFLFGNVLLEVHSHSHIIMTGDSKFTTSEAVLSLMRPVRISNDTVISCKGGSVLGVTPTQVTNHIMTLNTPSLDDEFATQCSPACLFTPEADPFEASGGFLASCIPCPRGTYSIAMSSN